MRKFIRTGYGEADGVLVCNRQLICIAGEVLNDGKIGGLFVVVVNNFDTARVTVRDYDVAHGIIAGSGYTGKPHNSHQGLFFTYFMSCRANIAREISVGFHYSVFSGRYIAQIIRAVSEMP